MSIHFLHFPRFPHGSAGNLIASCTTQTTYAQPKRQLPSSKNQKMEAPPTNVPTTTSAFDFRPLVDSGPLTLAAFASLASRASLGEALAINRNPIPAKNLRVIQAVVPSQKIKKGKV